MCLTALLFDLVEGKGRRNAAEAVGRSYSTLHVPWTPAACLATHATH